VLISGGTEDNDHGLIEVLSSHLEELNAGIVV